MWDRIISYVLLPIDAGHLAVFYLFWIGIFVCANTFWDIKTPVTRKFHFLHLKEKNNVLYDGASFCSNLIVLLSLVSADVQKLSTNITIPLIIAGISGILRSITGICPYKMEDVEKAGQALEKTILDEKVA
jgi:hypothetical protein